MLHNSSHEPSTNPPPNPAPLAAAGPAEIQQFGFVAMRSISSFLPFSPGLNPSIVLEPTRRELEKKNQSLLQLLRGLHKYREFNSLPLEPAMTWV